MLSQKVSDLWVDLKGLLRNTTVEVYALAIIGAVGAGLTSYNIESRRELKIPLGFSEKTQIEKDAEREGRKVGRVTSYLTSANDAVMKVFECWNTAHSMPFTDTTRAFANELEMRLDPTFKFHHYEIQDLLQALPQQANSALDELRGFIQVMNSVGIINKRFDDAWNDTHIDHYRIETYTTTETYTDSKGNLHTRLVTRTRTVYDYTTHSYRYTKKSGEEASRFLDDIIRRYFRLEFKENIITASKTNAEGEYAVDVSRGKTAKTRLTQQELKSIADTWYTGSTLRANLPIIYGKWQELKGDAEEWRTAKNTARSRAYDTASHFDPGPKEFQTAERASQDGMVLYASIDEIINGIKHTEEYAPVLYNKIREFVGVVLDKKEGNAKKLSEEIMDISKEMYHANFKKGLDIERFRGYMVMLYALGGIVLGGLLGIGLNYAGDKFKWYNIESHKAKNIFQKI